MKNPWKTIKLEDYENHMQLEDVRQLQALNHMMQAQFRRHNISHIMILGIAGGNGLEHIKETAAKKVYGIDINEEYLQICQKRYIQLKDRLELIAADLMDESLQLPEADLVVADLLIEYIGYTAFQRIIPKVKPSYVSCVIQMNTEENFISQSPYLHVFKGLEKVHHQMNKVALNETMAEIKYKLVYEEEVILPNGKRLVCLEYRKNI